MAAEYARDHDMMTQEFYKEIARLYGTPTYVFDTQALQERVQAVSSLFGPSVRLCYSIKANPFLIPAMMDVLPCLEVCSPGELAICEMLGGYAGNDADGMDAAAGAAAFDGACDLAAPAGGAAPMQVPALASGRPIIYSGVHKEAADIREAIQYGVMTYTAESVRHVRLLEQEAAAAGQTVEVLLRLHSGAQFGMSQEDLRQVLTERGRYPHLSFVGIHYFVGTQRRNKELNKQRKELLMLRDLFTDLRAALGIDLPRLEYGPGLYVPLFADEDYEDTLAPARMLADALREAATWCELTVEMGRFLVTACGHYLTRVVDTKAVPGKDGIRRYAITDGGINHVNYVGQIMGMKTPVICHIAGVAAASCTEQDEEEIAAAEPEEWTLCGSLCTTNDDLVRSIRIPGLDVGSLLVFENIGAYSVTEGIYLFLSRTMPRILLYNGRDIICVREPMRIAGLNTPRML